MIMQVWRPLKGPVDDSPLALVDAQTVRPDDLMQNQLQFPDRLGHTYSVKHNPGMSACWSLMDWHALLWKFTPSE